jgi:predicted MPP superfamily phosphohydrolase
MSERELLLLHLSDIHFHKGSGSEFDLDSDLRRNLEEDSLRVTRHLNMEVDCILITGDIAYSGVKKQYDIAYEWLRSLCDMLGCPKDNVWTVPGNHDVNRNEIKEQYTIRALHENLRSKSVNAVDEAIESCFSKGTLEAELLFRPLREYLKFSRNYGGSRRRNNQLFWEDWLDLNDGYKLRICGLNSTLVSDDRDSERSEDDKLLLGQAQILIPRDPGVVNLSMCHHPPDWLKDKSNVESYFNTRVHLQLFGHKHKQSLMQIDNSVQIISGATHPERSEPGWKPRYNFIKMHVSPENEDKKLKVRVYPRVWSEENTHFIADFQGSGIDNKEFSLKIPDLELRQKERDTETIPKGDLVKLGDKDTPEEGMSMESSRENPYRKLVYRFYGLSYNTRFRIMDNLNLITNDDENLDDMKLFNTLLKRAKEQSILDKLWEELDDAYGIKEKGKNPFKVDREGK